MTTLHFELRTWKFAAVQQAPVFIEAKYKQNCVAVARVPIHKLIN